MELAANPNAQSQVRSTASDALRGIAAMLRRTASAADTAAHYRALIDDIDRFLKRPDSPRRQPAQLPNPPGDPIGGN